MILNKTPEQQLKLFKNRGIRFIQSSESQKQDAKLIHKLGYYKLKEFAYPYAYKDGLGDLYYRGLSFKHLVSRYRQDKNLRMYILNPIESIEVDFNSNIADILGNYGAFGYLEFKNWDNRNTSKFSMESKQFYFKRHLQNKMKFYDRRFNALKDINSSKNRDNDGFPTVWLMVNLITFGDSSHLLLDMSKNNQFKIAKRYQCTPKQLKSWMKCLNFVRNICAHNADLLDIDLRTRPTLPSKFESYTLSNWHLSAVIFIVKYLMDEINPHYHFNKIYDSLIELIDNDSDEIRRLGFKDADAIKILNGD